MQLSLFCSGACAVFASVAAFELIMGVLKSLDVFEDDAKPPATMVEDAWNKMVSTLTDLEVASCSVGDGDGRGGSEWRDGWVGSRPTLWFTVVLLRARGTPCSRRWLSSWQTRKLTI